ncbi:MAG: universal stress protein [Spirochaetales bacterium]
MLVNGSVESIHAAQYGILMAKLYRCSITAIYVVDTATLKQLTLSKIFVAEESSEYEESLKADGMRYLTYVTELAEAKDVKIETQLRFGSVWSETVTVADDLGVNLILLGGVEKSAGGHETLRESYKLILQNTPCSVLTVDEKQIEQLYKLA